MVYVMFMIWILYTISRIMKERIRTQNTEVYTGSILTNLYPVSI